jgi:hypothetical protein
VNKQSWLTLIGSAVLVAGVPCRAVAQANVSKQADYDAFKRTILAARYAHDPRLTHPLQGKPASVANLGLQSHERQADPAANAAAKSGEFVTFDAPGAGAGVDDGTYAFSINPAGTIAGWYIDANFVFHGFLRARDGTVTTIDPLDSVFTQIWSINPAGTLTGDYCDTIACHGFLWTAHGAGTGFVEGPLAWSINPAGQVAGFYSDANRVNHGFLWKKQ